MQIAPLPSVNEVAAWMRLGEEAIKLAEDLAAPAFALRQVVSGLYTAAPVGVYLQADPTAKVAFVCDEHGAGAADTALVKSALKHYTGLDPVELAPGGFPWPDGSQRPLIKIAYSPFLRSTGEWLNFFPAHNAQGQQLNSPGPVQSMLTTGLLGAGLGYGTGWLAEQLFPENWKRGKLRKTLALAGGLAGTVPGAAWGITNKRLGYGFNAPDLLDHPRGAAPQMASPDLASLLPKTTAGGDANAELDVVLGTRYKQATAQYAARLAAGLDAWLKAAEWDTFYNPGDEAPRRRSPMDINVDELGRTLWDTATPSTAGLTHAVLLAARQMPGGDDPGFVTPAQMGNLAMHMGAGYLSGALVGGVLGALSGMPDETQNFLKRTGVYAGIARAVVPKLFGR